MSLCQCHSLWITDIGKSDLYAHTNEVGMGSSRNVIKKYEGTTDPPRLLRPGCMITFLCWPWIACVELTGSVPLYVLVLFVLYRVV